MARERTLKVVITGDATQLDRAFAKSSKDVDELGKRADHMSKRFSTGMKVAGAAAAGALVVGLKSSVSAAVEAEKSSAKLEAQLGALGISYRAHAKEIDNVIQKTSKLSGLDDEDLQDAFSNVVRATGNVNVALKDMTLVADLARAKHMDVAKAGEVVAKVHAGNVGALSRMGIAFVKSTANVDKLKASTDKATPAQLAAAKAADKQSDAQRALGVLQDKFSGQAKKYGDTTAGAADRAKVGFENLQEVVGARLTPVLAKVANKLADLADWAAENPGKFKAVAIAIGAVASAIGGLLVIGKVIAAVKSMRAAIVALNLVMAANPAVLIAAAVVGLGAALVIAYKKSETFRNIVDGAFKVVRAAAADMFDVFTFGLRQFLTGVGKIANVVSKVPGMGWLKGLSKAALGAAAELSKISSAIRGVPSEKTVNIKVKASKVVIDGHTFTVSSGPANKATGGIIPGSGDRDTVPIMATPGEFVIRKKVVEKFGPTFFAALNEGQEPQMRTGGGIIAKANAIDAKGYPYVWGGGHSRTGVPDGGTGRDPGTGFDCSGAVSAILGVSPPRVSGGFTNWGLPGPGSPNDTKVYANATHVFAVLNGRGWGTSQENPGGGAGWLSYNSRPGFTVRHMEDGGAKLTGSSAGDPAETVESGKATRTARAEKAGSRLVNKITAPFARALGSATKSAASLGVSIDDAGTAYGQAERRFGQSDEDLGTKAGRTHRLSEIAALTDLKKKTLANEQKRAGALRRAIERYTAELRKLEAARKKAHGAKRAKINERIKPIVDRMDELKAELKALGSEITDTMLDIGDLEKEAGEVSATADTAPDAADAGPSTTDEISRQLAHIDALERAGDITPADAQQYRINTIQQALAGKFGSLTDEETLNLRGDLKDATSALTQATVDNTAALLENTASNQALLRYADSVNAVTSMQAVRAMSDVISGQLGYRVGVRASMPGSGALARL